jgi:hypothetical protein
VAGQRASRRVPGQERCCQRAAGAALATETSAAGSVTGLAGLAAQLTTIDGRVDGLETLIASTNTKLDTLIAALGTANGHLANIKTNTDRIPP